MLYLKLKCLRFGLAAMIEFGNGGRVVNTASLAGIGAAGAKVGSAHYSAAKVSLDFLQFNMSTKFSTKKRIFFLNNYLFRLRWSI